MGDLPGALAKTTPWIGDANASYDEVHHPRAFAHVPVLAAEAEFVLRTRGPEHVPEIVAAEARAGIVSGPRSRRGPSIIG